MPSRLDTPDSRPKIEPGESGDSYEKRLDDWADSQPKSPGLYLPSFQGSRDGDQIRHYESLEHGGEIHSLLDWKTRNDGAANAAYKHKVEDFIGAATGDNGIAVFEGERAREIEEMGQAYVLDSIQKIMMNAYTNRRPYAMMWRTDNGELVGLQCEIDWQSEEYVVTKVRGKSSRDFVVEMQNRYPIRPQDGVVKIRDSDNVVIDA